MLKHFSALEPVTADALVGQYYTSRVFPLLLVSVALMFASSLLPHLIRDWEAGRHEIAMQSINRAVKVTAVGFTVGAAMLLFAAPIIFTWAFGGKYDAGLTVLPGTLVYCVWFSMIFFANRYLLCAENAKAGSIAFGVGLAANIALNYFLAPRFGLAGVVFATGVANAVALAITYGVSWRAGMQWDRGIVFATVLPLALCLGGWHALAVSMLACFVGWRGGWLFVETEKEALSEMLHKLVQRVRSLGAGSIAQVEG
jgi:O-antigen/teichoic acid export membrane protein